MIGLIKDDDDTIYQQQLAMFVNHCDANFLELNVSKTKEMILVLFYEYVVASVWRHCLLS